MKKSKNSWPVRYFDALLLLGLTGFVLVYFDLRYLFLDTTVTGGDTASWQGIAHHLAETLLPAGRLTGWDMGNFCGYPDFNFYFIPPFLLPVAVSKLLNLPLTICLKWAIMSGIFLLPALTYFGLRKMGYRFPGPIMGAAASLVFLFNESYTMFGGNTLSTFAGEFCYMLAFSVLTYFIGAYYRGYKTGAHATANGLLLGLIGLCHLFVFIPAAILVAYSFFDRAKIRYIAQVAGVAFTCMAFWIIPVIAYRDTYTSPIYMIWQEFISWRFTLAGLLIIELCIGPGLALAVLKNRSKKNEKLWHWGFVGFVAASVWTIAYLGCQYLLLGKALWHSGLNAPDFSTALIGQRLAFHTDPWAMPLAIGVGAIAFFVLGAILLKNCAAFEKTCRNIGMLCALALIILLINAIYAAALEHAPASWLKPIGYDNRIRVLFLAAASGILAWIVFRSKCFDLAAIHAEQRFASSRFLYWLALIAGCVTVYFGAHFLKVPDIRFLPPTLYALIMMVIVETPAPFWAERTVASRAWIASITWFAVFFTIVLIAKQAGNWYAYNNSGYESKPGYKDFAQVNQYLRQSYPSKGKDLLNAPRAGYEKCDLYSPYGGDRVFESLPLFSGRQTLEGIHYASAFSARCIAYLQTEFSRDIKTPTAEILSKINISALPAHFDLYNISQLIVGTPQLKRALGASEWFSKEAAFGNLWIFRYLGCNGKYVEVPRVRPVLYSGENWPDAFYEWLKRADPNAALLVPDSFVKDPRDRATFSSVIAELNDLDRLKSEPIAPDEDAIQVHLDHLKIRFHTNRIGQPHLVKVSYFPNWRVQGANAVYPVSPHMMLVIPRQPEVVLTYGRSGWELAGGAISISGWLIMISGGIYRKFNRRGKRSPRKKFLTRFWKFIQKVASASRPWLMLATLAAAMLIIITGAILRDKPVRTYIEGHRCYQLGATLSQQENTKEADRYFNDAIRVMRPLINDRRNHDHRDVINCLLISAQCFERLNQYAEAEALYRIIVSEYSYSRYAAEGYVKIARLARQDMEALWGNEIARPSVQTGGSRTVSQFEHPIRELEKCVATYRQAFETEPFSIWVSYARQDLEQLNQVLENIQNKLASAGECEALSTVIETVSVHRRVIKELMNSSELRLTPAADS